MNAGRSDLSIFEYTGEGASHSWLWLADSMERLGVTGLRFGDFGRGIPDADMIVISGGDFGKMTRAIGDANFASLQSFVRNGGTYLGLCSGA